MEVTVALESRYLVTPDGCVWSKGGMARPFWERYLDVFDQVRIVARGRSVARAEEHWEPVTGKNIVFQRLPDYHGPWGYLTKYFAFREAIKAAAPVNGAVILRVASHIANCLEAELRRRQYPFALEVLGDPHEVFASKCVEHPLRPLLRWYFTKHMRRQCRSAFAVAYVTQRALQERYPTRDFRDFVPDVEIPTADCECTSYPSAELDDVTVRRTVKVRDLRKKCTLVSVGSLEHLYKGTDVLIEAVAQCTRAGFNVLADIVGDGRKRPDFVAQAERAGMAQRIRFLGHLPAGRPVRDILDAADIFVLPSRSEGLPRALLEAMSRGLPCIASAVGGIPEVLEPDALVPTGDPSALAAKIMELVQDSSKVDELAARNSVVLARFHSSVVGERRRQFLQHIRGYMEERAKIGG